MNSRHLAALLAALLMGGCSTVRPWQNLPARADAPPMMSATTQVDRNTTAPSIVAAITLSGGGARAAAFGLGVLQELKETHFEWEGRQTTLLNEVGLVSGVSGGSVLAAYYAAFGEETLTRFEPDFLLINFQSGLIGRALSPDKLYDMTSSWFGRSNVLAERLDGLYRGRTFGALQARPRGPRLLVTATDLTSGAPFQFTAEQFALICSDLASVPLSFAVAASSSVPVLLSPMTLRNYAGDCPLQSAQASDSQNDGNYRVRMLQDSAKSYQDAKERPYLHLVDGGLSDNLGVRALLDRSMAGGSIKESFRGVAPGSVRKIILVAVNSERDTSERIDKADHVPSTSQVMDSLLFGAGARATQETLALLNDDARRWSREIAQQRGSPDSPFAADAEFYVVSVSLRDVPDSNLRQAVLQVPTAFTVTPAQVSQLKEAGRAALRESPEFQRLRRGLGAAQPPSMDGPTFSAIR